MRGLRFSGFRVWNFRVSGFRGLGQGLRFSVSGLSLDLWWFRVLRVYGFWLGYGSS